MDGIIVVNTFMVISPIQYCIDRLIYEFRKLDVELEIKTSFDIQYDIFKGQFEAPRFAIFFDKDVEVAKMLEGLGVKVFNKAEAIKNCDDKFLTYSILKENKIPQPVSFLSPLNYSNLLNDVILYRINELFTFPFVVKACFGSQGNNVFLVKNRKQFTEIEQELVRTPHMYQEFIEASAGKDYRVIVIGHKVIGSIKRESKNSFKSNIGSGGEASVVELPKAYYDLAIKVSKILNLDYTGIDILEDENKNPIICEVNSNAFFRAFEQATAINVAKAYAEYVVGKLNETK